MKSSKISTQVLESTMPRARHRAAKGSTLLRRQSTFRHLGIQYYLSMLYTYIDNLRVCRAYAEGAGEQGAAGRGEDEEAGGGVEGCQKPSRGGRQGRGEDSSYSLLICRAGHATMFLLRDSYTVIYLL